MNRGKHKRPGTLKVGTASVWSPMSSAVLHGLLSCLQSPRLAPCIVPGAMLSSSTQRAHRPLLLGENAPRDAWRAQRLLGLAPLQAEGAECCLTAGHLEGKCGLCSMGSSACPGSGMKQSSTWNSAALLDAGVVGRSSLSPARFAALITKAAFMDRRIGIRRNYTTDI